MQVLDVAKASLAHYHSHTSYYSVRLIETDAKEKKIKVFSAGSRGVAKWKKVYETTPIARAKAAVLNFRAKKRNSRKG
jgi:hypothetical protein